MDCTPNNLRYIMAFEFLQEQIPDGQPNTIHYIYNDGVVIQMERSSEDLHSSIRLSVSGGGLLICDMKSCSHGSYNSIINCAVDAVKRYLATKGNPSAIEFSLREGSLVNFGRNLVDEFAAAGYTLGSSRYSELRGATKFIFVK
jgi:hypothetical protein